MDFVIPESAETLPTSLQMIPRILPWTQKGPTYDLKFIEVRKFLQMVQHYTPEQKYCLLPNGLMVAEFCQLYMKKLDSRKKKK
jgi:hypothetical protein